MIGLVLGHSGCGKSTWLIKNILNSPLSNTIIYPEASELKNKKTDDVFDYYFFRKIKFKPNHIYIFDDAFFLRLDSEKKMEVLAEFFVRARKYNTHLLFIYH